MILERTIIGLVVLILIITGKQNPHKTQIKWLCYVIAAVIWGLGQYWLQSNWIDMLISIAGIELFAWLISGYADDRKKAQKRS